MNNLRFAHIRALLADRKRRPWLVLEAILATGIAVFVVYCLTKFQFAGLLTDEGRQGDFLMWYLLPPQIRARDYPSAITGNWDIAFAYFPSAVVMMLPLSWIPQPLSFALWMILQCASLVVILRISLQFVGLAQSRLRMPIAAAAVLIVSSPLQWDLRGHNNNLIYLAAIMLALVSRRTWVSAFLLAATANLKFYSGLLVAGFLWRREYRLAFAMMAAGLLLAFVLPALVYGPTHFIKLIFSWLDQLGYTMSPAGQALVPLSIKRTATALLGDGSVAAAATLAAKLAWLALIAAYFLIAARPGARGSDSKAARLCDVLVLLLLPLPFSTWFVPYHALVLLPAFVVIFASLADRAATSCVRISGCIAVAGCAGLHLTVRAWELRAGVYLVDFALVVIALGAIRLSLARPDVIKAASPPS